MSTSTATRRNLRSQDVLDLTGATYRQLDHWVKTYEVCEQGGTEGSGSVRLFTITETRLVRALVLMGQHGIVLGTYARATRKALHAQPEAAYLVLSDDKVSAHLTFDRARDYVSRTPEITATILPLRLK